MLKFIVTTSKKSSFLEYSEHYSKVVFKIRSKSRAWYKNGSSLNVSLKSTSYNFSKKFNSSIELVSLKLNPINN